VGSADDQATGQNADRDRVETATRDELRDVEEEIAGLRAQARSVRNPFGRRDAGPMDLAENASQITAAEEQEALIEVLESRRDTLLRRLDSLR
jgi:hypothetical protein